jgi:hypothetical protein
MPPILSVSALAAQAGYRWGGRPPTASMCQSGVLMTPHEGGARDDG